MRRRKGRALAGAPLGLKLSNGHAGSSSWTDPRTHRLLVGLNCYTVVIELANAESDPGALSWARKQPGFKSIRARHTNGGPEQEWECYGCDCLNDVLPP